MRRAIALLALCFAVSLDPRPSFAQFKKARLAIPTVDIVTLPLKMAQAKGFYQKEALEVEIILIAGALGVRAVLGNSVDFSTASGSILAAAARGVPVKLISVITSKPTFDLISESKIQSFQQLKGKLVGISTRGGTFEHITRLILEKNGCIRTKTSRFWRSGGRTISISRSKPAEFRQPFSARREACCFIATGFTNLPFRATTCRIIRLVDWA
jgi:ABC-type nitrate/sulfonate/bicarbonate transport system substrate-binding protein